jgi:hypothetical protein
MKTILKTLTIAIPLLIGAAAQAADWSSESDRHWADDVNKMVNFCKSLPFPDEIRCTGMGLAVNQDIGHALHSQQVETIRMCQKATLEGIYDPRCHPKPEDR